ncbi:MAG TPA: L-seryl-tRNA(Sec) selenium transferase, partial [Candidatus Binatia bacterium]|nr:L-seryl-tRNA(Sec) selenium transferase [Candidatus Binatia bacterium]
LPATEIERRARALAARLPAGEAEVEISAGQSVVGGGSTPAQSLPTCLMRISALGSSAVEIEARLREPAAGMTPVIARIEEDRLVLDLRTVDPAEESALAETLLAALR